MSRRKFRISLAYAQTIIRLQRQTYDDEEIILYSPVFSHGQRNVALSRGRNKKRIKVVLKHENIISEDRNYKIVSNYCYMKDIVFSKSVIIVLVSLILICLSLTFCL